MPFPARRQAERVDGCFLGEGADEAALTVFRPCGLCWIGVGLGTLCRSR